MKPQKKSFGAEISIELADTFTAYVEEIGFQKYRAIEAALRLFVRAPVDVQVACMCDNSSTSKALSANTQIDSYRAKVQKLVDKGLPLNLVDNVLRPDESAPSKKKKDKSP